YPGGRPRVVLSKEVRRIGGGMMRDMAEILMATHGLKKEDVAHFVLHSAGRRVIEQAKTLLELTDAQIANSRHVLRVFGNMSSATILFVLEEALRSGAPQTGDWGLMIALGPGFAAAGRAGRRWQRRPPPPPAPPAAAAELLAAPVPLAERARSRADLAPLNG